MHLSRLQPDARRPDVQRDLNNCYEMHRTIMRAVPDGRTLWRLDSPHLLVQSQSAPDWGRLPDGYLVEVASKPFELSVVNGQRLRFRLRANPTVCRNGKRHGLLREADQMAWLERKAATGWFAVHSVLVSSEGVTRGDKNRCPIIRLAVRFDGMLTVTDADMFRATMAVGIGAGKSFGFGLLSLAL